MIFLKRPFHIVYYTRSIPEAHPPSSFSQAAKAYLRALAGGETDVVMVGVHVRRTDTKQVLANVGRQFEMAAYFERAFQVMADILEDKCKSSTLKVRFKFPWSHLLSIRQSKDTIY